MRGSRTILLWALGCLLAVPAAGCAGLGQRKWPKPLAWLGGKQDELGPNIQTPAERIEALRQLAAQAPQMPPAEQDVACSELARGLLAEEDTLVRAQMLHTVAAFPTPLAGALLKAGLSDTDRDVRVACCEAWGKRGTLEAAQLLGQVISTDTEIDVRLAAARALEQIEDPQTGPAAVAALATALEDPDPAMKHRAVLSLEQVTGRDFGNDVNAWRQFVQGEDPPPPTFADRLRRWF